MVEKHKSVIRRVFDELFNLHRLELVPELYTDDCFGKDPANPAQVCGHDALIALIEAYRTAFPDHYYVLHEVIAEGRYACARWTVFTHTDGDERQFAVDGLSLCEFRDGKVSKVWQQWDNLKFLQELDAVDANLDVSSVLMKKNGNKPH